jgi:hypothetical protein
MSILVVPSRVTDNDSYQLTKLCFEADRIKGELTLDCSNASRFAPLGLAMVASIVALRKEAGKATVVIPPNDADTRAFLDEVGFDGLVAGRDARPGTLELRQMKALHATYTQQVVDLLAKRVSGAITAENGYPIQLCLNELLQNVFEWSASPIGCIIFCRWYRQTKSVRLAVVDRGIGLPAALRREKVQELQRATDAEVIEAAVSTPLLTSRRNRIGGLGLKTIRELVCDRNGRLTVVSLGAKVTWRGSRVTKFQNRTLDLFRGTAIEIDIRPSPGPLTTDVETYF